MGGELIHLGEDGPLNSQEAIAARAVRWYHGPLSGGPVLWIDRIQVRIEGWKIYDSMPRWFGLQDSNGVHFFYPAPQLQPRFANVKWGTVTGIDRKNHPHLFIDLLHIPLTDRSIRDILEDTLMEIIAKGLIPSRATDGEGRRLEARSLIPQFILNEVEWRMDVASYLPKIREEEGVRHETIVPSEGIGYRYVLGDFAKGKGGICHWSDEAWNKRKDKELIGKDYPKGVEFFRVEVIFFRRSFTKKPIEEWLTSPDEFLNVLTPRARQYLRRLIINKPGLETIWPAVKKAIPLSARIAEIATTCRFYDPLEYLSIAREQMALGQATKAF